MARALHRIGLFSARKWWVVLIAWALLVGGVVAAVNSEGANTSNNLELPGSDSQEATDLLTERFPPQQNGKNPIVFRAKTGTVTDPANKTAIDQSHTAIAALPHVDTATSPFSQEGAAQISKDKRTAFITVLLEIGNEEITEDIAQSFLDAAEPARKARMEVAAGGQIGTELSEPATESSEVIGLAAAMVILAFTFGTLVAMGLPIISAVFGLITGISLIGLLGHVTEVPTIAPTLATMIGLGVGIDYALFLVSRYRSELQEGKGTHDAVATAVSTSGTAIVFAGGTVVIALVSLLVAGIPLVTSLGYASAVAVLTAVLASITLLPAILSLLGHRIDSLRLPSFLHPKQKPPERGFWGAWARFVTGRPYRSVFLALLILVPLIIPFFSLELGQEDVGATPTDTTERQAYDLLSSGFGPGYTGPLLIAVALGTPATANPEVTKQLNTAEGLKTQLEQEQKEGQAQQKQLQQEATALQDEQAELQREAADLNSQAAELDREKKQIEANANTLKGEAKSLKSILGLLDQTVATVKQSAEILQQGVAILKQLQQARTRGDTQREGELEQRYADLVAQLNALKSQGATLEGQVAQAQADAKALSKNGRQLVNQAASAARHAIDLLKKENALEQSAASAQVEAAQLQTEQAELEAQKQQAEQQQKQAENLQSTLTEELTAAGGDERATDPRLVALQDALTGTIGVELVSPPVLNQKGDAAIFTVVSKSDPADDETADLVQTIRDYVIPQSTQGTDLNSHVGGQTASYVDLASAITDKLPLVIFVVISLGFLVLMMAFRSIVIPAQAALANVLSVMAAFGVVTACFQYGWGLDLVGIDTASDGTPIASFVPLIMFAVLFGLSMDYQVFLISWIEYNRARYDDDREAVAAGLATGARVISAAALIMIAVFGSFILNGDPTVKQFGVGLSVGVALAAAMVLLLAPALIVLAGKGAWWVPHWVDRYVPHLDIEGAGASRDEPAEKPQ